MGDTAETRWFKIIVTIVSGFFIGIAIANIVYYNRIRSGTCNAVTKNEANVMFWINIVILVIAVIIFLWSLWRLLFTQSQRSKAGKSVDKYFSGERTGFIGEEKPTPTSRNVSRNLVETKSTNAPF